MGVRRYTYLQSFRIIVLILTLLPFHILSHPTLEKRGSAPIVERAVTFGHVGNANSASAICTGDQEQLLEKSMTEAAALAKAGSYGLNIIRDMLTKDKKEYYKLAKSERDRIRLTFYTFFGEIENKGQWDTFKERAGNITTVLDRIKGLTPQTWPHEIKLFCDSTYYLDRDPKHETWDQKDPPLGPAPPGKVWKYDYDEKIWSKVDPKTDCHADGSRIPAYTLAMTAKKRDRMTFCPSWFEKVKAAGRPLTEVNIDTDIKVGTELVSFGDKAARYFLHEHLHTWTFNQAGKATKLRDVRQNDSYGPANAAKIAAEKGDLASKNIENIVWWCIAMYFGTWDWKTLKAAEVK